MGQLHEFESEHMYLILILYLWTVFGQFSLHMSTETLQSMRSNPLVVHSFGFLCAIFLFNNSTIPISQVFLRSFVVYIAYLLISKCRWNYCISGISVLIIYDVVRRRISYLEKDGSAEIGEVQTQEENTSSVYIFDEKELLPFYRVVTPMLVIAFILVIVFGTIQLSNIEKRVKKDKFSWLKLFFGVRENFIFVDKIESSRNTKI